MPALTDETTTFEVTDIDAEELESGRWRIGFVIENHGPPRRVLESWLPHGRFRSERKRYENLTWGGEITLEHDADWDGEVVHNAFLILRLDDQRVFFRLRPDRVGIVVEKTTTQPDTG